MLTLLYVRSFVLPATKDSKPMWKEKFGFQDMSSQQVLISFTFWIFFKIFFHEEIGGWVLILNSAIAPKKQIRCPYFNA